MTPKVYLATGILIAMAALMVQFQKAESIELAIALEGCQDHCGGIPVPFPFGFGPDCSLEGFDVECNITNHSLKLVSLDLSVSNISLSLAQARINTPVSYQCYSRNNKIEGSDYTGLDLDGSPFRINSEKNKFTVIGCDTQAQILFSTREDLQPTVSVCTSYCLHEDSIINGSCFGAGCCQLTIPKNLLFYYLELSTIGLLKNYNHCSYFVLMEDNGFVFNSEYITTRKLYKQQMPAILDWAIGNVTCDVAQANRTSYACISSNSICVNSRNGPGYICNCSTGYEGNPYLQGGCQDIDECADKNRCSKKCHNLPGTFKCSCPVLMRLKHNSADGQCELSPTFVLGTCISIMLLVFLGFFMYAVFERRKLSVIKEKYFQQHGGWILLEEIQSNIRFSFTIFSKQEVEQATNNFDSANIIGQGGQGIVYKGNIKGELVAIKKCKIIDESKKKEFGKEMVILSQISHKNTVKLLGCCLEVEVPMLVYEYISNGTLFDHIHHKKHGCSITLEDRLRIAHESAEALSYLHYSASPPIFHGDIKSSNILLDENFTPKISDFGASILAPTDESQFVTLVQGTCGYLDPEYLQSCRLTDKSDVYSFGVVLLELLTSKHVIDFEAKLERKSLSSMFLTAMKEHKMNEIVDAQIRREEDTEIINRIALLIEECLHVKGEDRPTMKEVVKELERIRILKNRPSEKLQYEKTRFSC